VAAISREDFEDQSSEYIKELQKSFKRDAKRFKTAAQLARENEPCLSNCKQIRYSGFLCVLLCLNEYVPRLRTRTLPDTKEGLGNPDMSSPIAAIPFHVSFLIHAARQPSRRPLRHHSIARRSLQPPRPHPGCCIFFSPTQCHACSRPPRQLVRRLDPGAHSSSGVVSPFLLPFPSGVASSSSCLLRFLSSSFFFFRSSPATQCSTSPQMQLFTEPFK
jgi:hypothetical protein